MGVGMLTLRYLRYWHSRFNKQCFGNQLSKPDLQIIPWDEAHLGWCHKTKPVKIEICDTSDLVSARRALLHEMIHQWQLETGQPFGHGPSFQRKATQCFDSTGLSPVFS